MYFIIFFGLTFAAKVLWKLILYSPLWFAGYVLSTFILDKEASGLAYIGLIALIALCLNYLLLFIKGIIFGLKDNGKLIWFPLFMICLFFTGILPVSMMFENINQLMIYIYSPQANLLTWISASALVVFMFVRFFRLA